MRTPQLTSMAAAMPDASLRRGALTLTAAGMFDFALQLLLPVALVRLLPAPAFADYRLAWLAIGAAMALAPLGLPRSLFYFLPRAGAAERAVHVRNTMLLLLLSGACAGLLFGPWNSVLPTSLRGIAGAAWFLPAFLTLWVAASLAEFLPSARGDVGRQARLIVALAVLRVAAIALAALWGRVELVFAALVAYAAFKLALVVGEVRRQDTDVDPARSDGCGGPPPPPPPPSAHESLLRTQLAYALPFGMAGALFLLRGQADQWVAAALFPPAAFAAFSIGAVIMPLVALVRTSVANAIGARLSALEARRDVAGMLGLNQRANLAVAFVLLPVLVLTAVLAAHIVALVYTSAFLAAAAVMRVNCLALLGVAVEVSTLTLVLNQGRYLLAADALLLPLGLAAGIGGAVLWGLPGAALGNLLTLGAGNAFSFWRVARATGVPLRRLQRWGALLRILACALAAAVPALLLLHAGMWDAALHAASPCAAAADATLNATLNAVSVHLGLGDAPSPLLHTALVGAPPSAALAAPPMSMAPGSASRLEAVLAAALYTLAYLLLLRGAGLLAEARSLLGWRAPSCRTAAGEA